jgi:Sec-independent protein secretion pathway component TatC
MNRKDRIAIVISILYFLFPLGVLFDGNSNAPVVALVFTSPLIAYWGYRFIKNDISFLKSSEKEEA